MRLNEFRTYNEVNQVFESFNTETEEPTVPFNQEEKKYLSTLGFKHSEKGKMCMRLDIEGGIDYEVRKHKRQYVCTRTANSNTRKWYMPNTEKFIDLELLSNLMQSTGIHWTSKGNLVATKLPASKFI